MPDVTQILSAIEAGDPKAAAELLPLVYDELRKLAAARLADEKPGQTLQPTALVHEAYLRRTGTGGGTFSPRLLKPCAASSSRRRAGRVECGTAEAAVGLKSTRPRHPTRHLTTTWSLSTTHSPPWRVSIPRPLDSSNCGTSPG
jgi:hypothetical protein